MPALGSNHAHRGTVGMAAKKKVDRHLKRQLGIRLDPDIVRRAEEFAERHHRTLTAVFELALKEYLDKYGDLPPIEEMGR